MMKRYSKTEAASFLVAVIVFVMFSAAAVLSLRLYSYIKQEKEKTDAERANAQTQLSAAEQDKSDLQNEKETLSAALKVAQTQLSELEERISELESRIEALMDTGSNGGEIAELENEIKKLEAAVSDKSREIEQIKEKLGTYEDQGIIDLRDQYLRIAQLESFLSEKAPMNENVSVSDGNSSVTYSYPQISVYYIALGEGSVFSYGYNEDTEYSSDSLIKAAFALSVLQKASDEKEEYDRLVTDHMINHGSAETMPPYERKYDLDEKFILTEDSVSGGTGIIKDFEIGTELSYYELLEYLLKYGDNTAYKALVNKYGKDIMSEMLKSLGASGIDPESERGNAKDFAAVMKAVYEFTEGGRFYSDFMKQAMTQSAGAGMICGGVSPKNALHMCGLGEGAYHDMAIVYGSRPYALVFMSDMDGTGEETNRFIRNAVSLIDDLHESIYK